MYEHWLPAQPKGPLSPWEKCHPAPELAYWWFIFSKDYVAQGSFLDHWFNILQKFQYVTLEDYVLMVEMTQVGPWAWSFERCSLFLKQFYGILFILPKHRCQSLFKKDDAPFSLNQSEEASVHQEMLKWSRSRSLRPAKDAFLGLGAQESHHLLFSWCVTERLKITSHTESVS